MAKLSIGKIEKIVNPPSKPTVRNIRVSRLKNLGPFADAENSPIRKQPRIFTTKVPDGKTESTCCCLY